MDYNTLNSTNDSPSFKRYCEGNNLCYDCENEEGLVVYLLTRKTDDALFIVVRCKECLDYYNNKTFRVVEQLNEQDIFTLKLIKEV